MDASVMLFGGIVFLISHCCVYKFGKYQGWMDALRHDAQYGKAGLHLKAGETFLGVVDAKHGPCFFIGPAGKEVTYEERNRRQTFRSVLSTRTIFGGS